MSLDGNRAKRNSKTLVVTFAMGMGVGAVLAYALLAVAGINFSTNVPAPPPVAPESTETPAPPPVAALPGSPSAASDAADLGGLWPARHLFIGLSGLELTPEEADLLRAFKPGGVLLDARNMASASQTEGLVEAIKLTEGLGTGVGDLPLIAVAQEGGAFNPLGLENAPAFEVLGKRNDEGAAVGMARAYAVAARERGIGLLFAPVLDVYQPGMTPAGLRPRLFGEDRQAVWRLGQAFIEGVRTGGAMPVAKWLPGIGGGPEGEDPQLALRRIAERIFPLSQAVAAGLPAMLVAHTPASALNPESPTLPASMSANLLNKLVRQSWRFRGVLIADDVTGALAMRSPDDAAAPPAFPAPESAAADAIVAGCDMAVLARADWTRLERTCAEIAYRFRPGAEDAAKLQASATRIGDLQQFLGAKPAAAVTAPPAQEPAPTPPAPEATPQPPEPAPTTPEAAPVPEVTPPTPEPVPPAPETTSEKSDLSETSETSDTSDQSDRSTAASPALEQTAPVPPAPAPPAETPKPETTAPPEGAHPVKHRIAQGDTLHSIARKYDVKVKQVQDWNHLKDNTIKLGDELTLYVNDGKSAPAPETKPPAETAPAKTNTAAVSPATSAPETTSYTVAPGDSLGRIAGRFGTTQAHLMEINGIKDANAIKAGQTLKVPGGAH